MNLIIKQRSSEPIYQQIARQIRNQIIEGELEADDQLPSIRGLAKDLKISIITTKKAYEALEADGWIYTLQGRGSFVAPKSSEIIREENLRKIEFSLSEVKRLAGQIGLSEDEVMEMYRDAQKEEV